MLMQLEAPDVLGRRGVGRAAKERGEAPDMTDVILLRMRSQPRISMSCCMRWRSGVIGASVDKVAMASSSR